MALSAPKPRSLADLRQALVRHEHELHMDPTAVTEEDLRAWIELLDDLFVNVGVGDRWNSCADSIISYMPPELDQGEDANYREDAAVDILEIIYRTRNKHGL